MKLFKNKINLLLIIILVTSLMMGGFNTKILAENKEVIDVSLQTNVEGTMIRTATERIFEVANEKLDDYELNPTIYTLGEISDSGGMIEAVQAGMIDMGTNAPAWASDWVPEIGIIEQTFLYDDAEQLFNLLNHEGLGDYLVERFLEEANVNVISWPYMGSRIMFFVDEITSHEDLEGLDFRIPDARPYRDLANIIGFSAVSVAWGDVYTSLQSGLVKGLEGPPQVVYAEGFHEPNNYFWITNHMEIADLIFVNQDVYNSWPSEVQEAIDEAGIIVAREIYEKVVEEEEEYYERLEEAGLERIELETDIYEEKAKEYHIDWAESTNAMHLLEEYFYQD